MAWRRQADRAISIAISVAVCGTITSFLGHALWLFELQSHFRLQMAAGSLGLAVAALGLRRVAMAGVAVLLMLVHLGPLLPYIRTDSISPLPGNSTPLRILVANVGMHNHDYRVLLEVVRAENPDIVGLLEASPRWAETMTELHSDYPFRVLRPEIGAYGLALYSRLPMGERDDSPYVEGDLQTALTVDLELQQVPVTLVLAHLSAPLRYSDARLRNTQITTLASRLKEDGNERRILIGDLNVTPWSPWYRPLVAEAGLANAAKGIGYRATWPVRPVLLRIPIDHCLVSDAFRTADVRTGRDFGSDHLPLIVDLLMSDDPAR